MNANPLLYHATQDASLSSIASEGLRSLSYWTDDEDVLAYYEETIEDEGAVVGIVAIHLDDLIKLVGETAIEPDHPGIEEPITGALGRCEDEINEEWDSSDQGWRDSLEIIRSLRCRAPVPAHALLVMNGDDLVPLNEFMRLREPIETQR